MSTKLKWAVALSALACAVGGIVACATAEVPEGELFDAGKHPGEGGPGGPEGENDGAPGDEDADSEPCTATPCVRSLSAGLSFACAVTDDGAVYCWGADSRGQTGGGDGTDGGPVRAPQKVVGIGAAKQVVTGYDWACALLRADSVYCWGHNDEGIISSPGNDDRGSTPMKRPDLPAKTIQIAGGYFHACAQADDGSVRCWGLNNFGQSGSEDGGASITRPNLVPDLAGVVQLRGGKLFTCGIFPDQKVKCFGHNAYGELAIGTTDNSSHPVPVAATGFEGPVVSLAESDGYHKHAILADGRLQGWGLNTYQELGLNNPADAATVSRPVIIPGLTDVKGAASGPNFSCAISGGRVLCWGRNNVGQTGVEPPDATSTTTPKPTEVAGIIDARQVVAGDGFACARIKGGGVVCWGDNSDGTLGRGQNIARDFKPAPIKF
jgi:alpha-tubulin suppressor-like RCC1 family protein